MRLLSFSLIAVGIILSSLGVTGQSGRASTALPTFLPDCQGVPVRAPSTITFACADGGIVATKIMWRDWGGYYAHGEGKLSWNDCTPNCASGHYQPYTAILTAFGKQRCPNGEIAYAGVKLLYQRIYTVAPYTIGSYTYSTRLGPMKELTQAFRCMPQ